MTHEELQRLQPGDYVHTTRFEPALYHPLLGPLTIFCGLRKGTILRCTSFREHRIFYRWWGIFRDWTYSDHVEKIPTPPFHDRRPLVVGGILASIAIGSHKLLTSHHERISTTMQDIAGNLMDSDMIRNGLERLIASGEYGGIAIVGMILILLMGKLIVRFSNYRLTSAEHAYEKKRRDQRESDERWEQNLRRGREEAKAERDRESDRIAAIIEKVMQGISASRPSPSPAADLIVPREGHSQSLAGHCELKAADDKIKVGDVVVFIKEQPRANEYWDQILHTYRPIRVGDMVLVSEFYSNNIFNYLTGSKVFASNLDAVEKVS